MQPRKSTTHPELYMHHKFHEPVSIGGALVTHATVFARKEGEEWMFVPAFCSIHDQFCRATGRNVARRRYFRYKGERTPITVLGMVGGPDVRTAAENVAKWLANVELSGGLWN